MLQLKEIEKLPVAEKQARLVQQQERLPGLSISGELQPSYALVDLACFYVGIKFCDLDFPVERLEKGKWNTNVGHQGEINSSVCGTTHAQSYIGGRCSQSGLQYGAGTSVGIAEKGHSTGSMWIDWMAGASEVGTADDEFANKSCAWRIQPYQDEPAPQSGSWDVFGHGRGAPTVRWTAIWLPFTNEQGHAKIVNRSAHHYALAAIAVESCPRLDFTARCPYKTDSANSSKGPAKGRGKVRRDGKQSSKAKSLCPVELKDYKQTDEQIDSPTSHPNAGLIRDLLWYASSSSTSLGRKNGSFDETASVLRVPSFTDLCIWDAVDWGFGPLRGSWVLRYRLGAEHELSPGSDRNHPRSTSNCYSIHTVSTVPFIGAHSLTSVCTSWHQPTLPYGHGSRDRMFPNASVKKEGCDSSLKPTAVSGFCFSCIRVLFLEIVWEERDEILVVECLWRGARNRLVWEEGFTRTSYGTDHISIYIYIVW